MTILKQKIGIIGGGQLGKMMILAGKNLNLHFSILDPTPTCPASSIANKHFIADFRDKNVIRQMAKEVDILTYEFEHIAVDVLLDLEAEGHTVYPSARNLQIIQNKYTQKQTLRAAGIAVPAFYKVNMVEDVLEAGSEFGYPMLLKSCYDGYDGKGNRVVHNSEDAQSAYDDLGGSTRELMIEEFINYQCEISVIVSRNSRGDIIEFPVGENYHEDNILIETKVPAQISKQAESQALSVAHQVLEVFQGVGTFCVEMFVTSDQILVNEIAPRPHNSGHYSIEGCVTSQFEQHVRAICGLPLGETKLVKPVIMRNLIGDRGPQPARYVGIEEALEIPGVSIHIYGKETVKPGRKMGHITVLADNLEEASEKAKKAHQAISFED